MYTVVEPPRPKDIDISRNTIIASAFKWHPRVLQLHHCKNMQYRTGTPLFSTQPIERTFHCMNQWRPSCQRRGKCFLVTKFNWIHVHNQETHFDWARIGMHKGWRVHTSNLSRVTTDIKIGRSIWLYGRSYFQTTKVIVPFKYKISCEWQYAVQRSMSDIQRKFQIFWNILGCHVLNINDHDFKWFKTPRCALLWLWQVKLCMVRRV